MRLMSFIRTEAVLADLGVRRKTEDVFGYETA